MIQQGWEKKTMMIRWDLCLHICYALKSLQPIFPPKQIRKQVLQVDRRGSKWFTRSTCSIIFIGSYFAQERICRYGSLLFGNTEIQLFPLKICHPKAEWIRYEGLVVLRGTKQVIEAKTNRITTTRHGILLLDILATMRDCDDFGLRMRCSDDGLRCEGLGISLPQSFQIDDPWQCWTCLAPLKALLIHTGRHGMCSALLQSPHAAIVNLLIQVRTCSSNVVVSSLWSCISASTKRNFTSKQQTYYRNIRLPFGLSSVALSTPHLRPAGKHARKGRPLRQTIESRSGEHSSL